MKKNFYILIGFVLTAILLAGFIYLKQKTPKPADLKKAQEEMVDKFNSNKAYSVDGLFENGKLAGRFYIPNTFDGTYSKTELNPLIDSLPQQTTSDPSVSVIKIEDKVYVKESDDSYKEITELNPIFVVMSNPSWINFQKQLPDIKQQGTNCAQYEIYFEKPGQEIINKITLDQLAQFRINGIALVDKGTGLLKEVNVHPGTESKNTITIKYQILDSVPTIEIPKEISE